MLCHEAFKAVRLHHKSNTRIEDTTNDALMRIADAEQIVIRPEDAIMPPLEPSDQVCNCSTPFTRRQRHEPETAE